ncbi:MAG: hypothetical protein J0H66_04490 [Solirubrobacterales bacterium]|nr:hypothetical protein [Solirubrobacterales bacterium]OJU94659.1 MAG: hypothetical protein BGO23_04520 [Solirubrobacterales bacterium 67-14]
MKLGKASVLILALAALFILPQSASALLPHSSTKYLGNGVERITYRVGPLTVTPGQNRIAFRPMSGVEKPAVDGWITRIKPNLVNEDGTVPLSSKVMFHHGVWINLSRRDATSGGQERFFATGEEKTITQFPAGYGYQYKASDFWLLNHMIHNLTPQAMTLYATYTIDFIPADSPAAEGIKPVTPIWMDVDNGSIYPVFDVWRGSGGKDGKFTYPDDAKNPYPNGVEKNKWTVDRDGVLLATAGHVHAGGLWTDLYLQRPGAKYQGPKCKKPGKPAVPHPVNDGRRKDRRQVNGYFKALRKYKAKMKKYRACAKKQPRVKGDKVHLYRSRVKYFEPAGPVSWDMAMYGSPANWKVEVKKGDVLSTNATYDSKRASWPESMGIMVVYMAEGEHGRNPYKARVDYKGKPVHGHYSENDDHGGGLPVVGRDPTKLPDGASVGANPFVISDFVYNGADFRLPGEAGRPPVVKKGKSLTFQLSDYDVGQQIWHSLTSCKTPCNKSTGIAYPIADGKFQFESGQLGDLPGEGEADAPTVGRTTWSTPKNLPKGTYTFFCRIHPLMRGAFRVK